MGSISYFFFAHNPHGIWEGLLYDLIISHKLLQTTKERVIISITVAAVRLRVMPLQPITVYIRAPVLLQLAPGKLISHGDE